MAGYLGSLERMRTIIAVVVCLIYFLGVLAGVPLIESTIVPWFLAAWSVAFVWCYLSLVRGRAVVALAVVVVVTLAFPIVSLFAIGWPIYRSWPALTDSLWSAFQERGTFGGVELLLPLIAAACCVALMRQLRSHPPSEQP